MPAIWPELVELDRAHSQLGKDEAGRTFHAEVVSWCTEQDITDKDERDAVVQLIGALDLEMGAIRQREHERMKEEAERRAKQRR